MMVLTAVFQVPDRVISRTFTGCMGEAFLQGLSIGLWNFEQIQNPEDCTACEERYDIALYMFVSLFEVLTFCF